mmetsp:Transcript_13669/g.36591  ORF Transcript_13669/g.36591 Transcript_13669/m.36591 type:complete len:120 (-) Transcript_13669:34-393(-)
MIAPFLQNHLLNSPLKRILGYLPSPVFLKLEKRLTIPSLPDLCHLTAEFLAIVSIHALNMRAVCCSSYCFHMDSSIHVCALMGKIAEGQLLGFNPPYHLISSRAVNQSAPDLVLSLLEG